MLAAHVLGQQLPHFRSIRTNLGLPTLCSLQPSALCCLQPAAMTACSLTSTSGSASAFLALTLSSPSRQAGNQCLASMYCSQPTCISFGALASRSRRSLSSSSAALSGAAPRSSSASSCSKQVCSPLYNEMLKYISSADGGQLPPSFQLPPAAERRTAFMGSMADMC